MKVEMLDTRPRCAGCGNPISEHVRPWKFGGPWPLRTYFTHPNHRCAHAAEGNAT